MKFKFRFNSIHTQVFVMFAGLSFGILLLFAYIAYIDIEKILRVFVTKDVVDSTLYLATQGDAENIEMTLETVIRWFALDLSVAFILIAAASIWISRSVTTPVKKGVQIANAISQGDLSQKISHHYDNELGVMLDSLNEMSLGLRELVKNVSIAAQNVNVEAQRIDRLNQGTARNMTSQATKVSEVSGTIDSVSSSFSEVATHADDLLKEAVMSKDIALQGGKAVADTVTGIESVNSTVEEGVKTVGRLGERDKKVGVIVDTIKEIAEQTNLLALNAAIEAARAGVHGRGFAVVADEVRQLADRTARATEEITRSIAEGQIETRDAIEQIELGAARVAEGVGFANKAGEALQQVVASVDGVQKMVESIAASTEEQSYMAQEVSRNTEAILASIQDTVNDTNETIQASEELKKKAAELEQSVVKFKLN